MLHGSEACFTWTLRGVCLESWAAAAAARRASRPTSSLGATSSSAAAAPSAAAASTLVASTAVDGPSVRGSRAVALSAGLGDAQVDSLAELRADYYSGVRSLYVMLRGTRGARSTRNGSGRTLLHCR